MERPIVPICLSFIAGIVVSSFWQIHDKFLLESLCLTLIIMVYFLYAKKVLAAILSLMLSFCILGILDMNVYRYHVPDASHISNYADHDKHKVSGMISDISKDMHDKYDMTISACKLYTDEDQAIDVHGDISLSVKSAQSLKYGDVVQFKTRLRIPENFNNPGGFDYKAYLRYRGILVRGFVPNEAGIVILREGSGNPLKSRMEAFRDDIKKLIGDHAPSPVAEIIQASILGNQKDIPKEVMEKFNLTGTSHIIAISGFNMSIVALVAIFITRMVMKTFPWLLLRFNWQRVSAISAAIVVFFYTFIAGAGISVVRATLMILVFMFAMLLRKIRDLGNTLALAALAILIVSPYDLYDVSFQLSFTAVIALLCIAPRLTRMIPALPALPSNRWENLRDKGIRNSLIFCAVTISATLGTLPLIVFYFNRFSAVVLLSNILCVPILGILAIPVCLAIIVAAPLCEPMAVLFINFAAILVKISLIIVNYLSALPYSSFILTTPTPVEISAYYLLIFVIIKLLDQWQNKKGDEMKSLTNFFDLQGRGFLTGMGICLIIFFIADFAHVALMNTRTGLLKMTAIDVGQGSSTLIRFPEKRIMLIDGGGFYDSAFDVGKYVVAPYLWHERISSIDVVVLTHPHPDHMNGLFYILEHFNVSEVWSNNDLAETEPSREFVRLLKRRNIPHKIVSAMTHDLDMEGVHVKCLNPERSVVRNDDNPMSFDDTNDQAVVLRLTYKNVSFYLPSDTSTLVEERIIKRYGDIKSNVLLSPHHGSRRSSADEFLRKLNPSLVVISAGKDNPFHLPHPDTLARYDARKIPVYRTDYNGAITVETDGNKLKIQTFQ
ncbi:MAG: ComE operon protein 3 [Syntrophus sp. SKADARSKE-3]|nr:ComE operon protein 3 [Syntrophus sp. SKADARSKE-3]